MSQLPPATVRVRVPATSANLGPGFDALGLALTLHDEVEATVTDGGLSLEVTGEGACDVADAGEKHLIVAAMRAAFDSLKVAQPRGLALRCVNRIPHGRGLGSSAAAIAAGVLAGHALAGADTRPAATLPLAAGLEGHPDNVAPCLYGGLTIAWSGATADGPQEVRTVVARGAASASERAPGADPASRGGAPRNEGSLPASRMVRRELVEGSGGRRGAEPPWGAGSGGLVCTPQGKLVCTPQVKAVRLETLAGITPVAIIAPAPVSTEVARGLLPASVSHADAARNSGRAALLVAALTARPEALLDATEDRLHQDYRAPVMPETHDLVGRLRAAGIPAVVSGAGPSVLAFLHAGTPGSTVLDSTVRETGISWVVSPLAVERQGASVVPVVPSAR